MSRYFRQIPVITPQSFGPSSGVVLTPIVDIENYKQLSLQWTLGDPAAPATIAGVVTQWLWYATVLPRRRVTETAQGADVALDPATNPDIWELQPSIAFTSLPNGAQASSILNLENTRGFAFLVGQITVQTGPLNFFALWSGALGD